MGEGSLSQDSSLKVGSLWLTLSWWGVEGQLECGFSPTGLMGSCEIYADKNWNMCWIISYAQLSTIARPEANTHQLNCFRTLGHDPLKDHETNVHCSEHFFPPNRIREN